MAINRLQQKKKKKKKTFPYTAKKLITYEMRIVEILDTTGAYTFYFFYFFFEISFSLLTGESYVCNFFHYFSCCFQKSKTDRSVLDCVAKAILDYLSRFKHGYK